jgi:hypothetical protein
MAVIETVGCDSWYTMVLWYYGVETISEGEGYLSAYSTGFEKELSRNMLRFQNVVKRSNEGIN